MDTLQEALFKAMFNDGWFADSDGDVEAPTGYFGYVVNAREDWSSEFLSAFEDTIKAYAPHNWEHDDVYRDNWIRNNWVGVYSAAINSDGIISIYKHGGYTRTPGVPVLGIEVTPAVRSAMRWYKGELTRYNNWQEN